MGKKGLSTHHRLIGGKLCLLLHHLYQISIELLQCVRASTGLSTNGFSPAPAPDPFALSVAGAKSKGSGNTKNGPFQKRIGIRKTGLYAMVVVAVWRKERFPLHSLACCAPKQIVEVKACAVPVGSLTCVTPMPPYFCQKWSLPPRLSTCSRL